MSAVIAERKYKVVARLKHVKNVKDIQKEMRHDFRREELRSYMDEEMDREERYELIYGEEYMEEAVWDWLAEQQANFGRRTGKQLRKDARIGWLVVISVPDLTRETYEEDERWREGFTNAIQGISDLLNVRLRYAVIHKDESTIHAHAVMDYWTPEGLPSSPKNKEEFRKMLSNVQEVVYSAFAEQGLPIRRRDTVEQRKRFLERLEKGLNMSHETVKELRKKLLYEESNIHALRSELDKVVAEAQRAFRILDDLKTGAIEELTEEDKATLAVVLARAYSVEEAEEVLSAVEELEKINKELREQLPERAPELYEKIREATQKLGELNAILKHPKLELSEMLDKGKSIRDILKLYLHHDDNLRQQLEKAWEELEEEEQKLQENVPVIIEIIQNQTEDIREALNDIEKVRLRQKEDIDEKTEIIVGYYLGKDKVDELKMTIEQAREIRRKALSEIEEYRQTIQDLQEKLKILEETNKYGEEKQKRADVAGVMAMQFHRMGLITDEEYRELRETIEQHREIGRKIQEAVREMAQQMKEEIRQLRSEKHIRERAAEMLGRWILYSEQAPSVLGKALTSQLRNTVESVKLLTEGIANNTEIGVGSPDFVRRKVMANLIRAYRESSSEEEFREKISYAVKLLTSGAERILLDRERERTQQIQRTFMPLHRNTQTEKRRHRQRL